MTLRTQEDSKDHSQEHCSVATCDSHLQNTRDLYGDKLAALDGDIGEVKDFYFDDKNWVIRYLVAGTGRWVTSAASWWTSGAGRFVDWSSNPDIGTQGRKS